MTLHKYIGRRPETLSTGRPLTRSDVVEPDLSHHHDRWLVEAGLLIPAEADKPLAGKALDDRCRELDIDGWSQMTADQKRTAVEAAETNAGGDQ